MKRLLLFAFIVLGAHYAWAYNQVHLVINDGIDNPQLKQQMERAVSAVMSEINRSQEKNLSTT